MAAPVWTAGEKRWFGNYSVAATKKVEIEFSSIFKSSITTKDYHETKIQKLPMNSQK